MKTTTEFMLLQMFQLLVASTWCGAAESEPRYADPPMPRYRVDNTGFDASAADIKAVCDSAGRELWRFFPDYEIEPFVVVRSHSGPIVLYERNAKGELVFKLDTQSTFWCQYAYQFTHEFCHVLCGFDKDGKENKWFEETVCETATMFAMRAMSEAWSNDPPYPHWKEYRHSIRKYVNDLTAKRDKIYEIYTDGLKGFYQNHKEDLRREGSNRELNGAMAIVMLRVFEDNPESWEAVRWLNCVPAAEGDTFQQHLQKWHGAVPTKHKPFVRQIGDLYGIEIATDEGGTERREGLDNADSPG